MMRANFKATLLSIVRSPSLLFWPLAFPIILSLVFSMMFSGLEQAYRLQPVSVAVVRDANYDKATGFDELLSSVDDDGDEWHVFDVSSVGSVAEAERKVVDGDVSGYICLDADANPSLHLSPRASFSLGSGSLTSAQSVLDSYIRVRSEMEDLAKKDPMLLADPTVLQRFSSDAVSTERLSVTANDPKASVRYYYALLGMAAAAFLGIPVLSLLVGPEAGKELQPFRGALVMVILGMIYCVRSVRKGIRIAKEAPLPEE